MAIRTNADDVKAVMTAGRDYDTRRNPSLTPYVAAASSVVDRLVALAAERGLTITSEQATLVETWLAAHAHCMSDQTYSSRSTQGASGSFHGQTGMYLDATKYGQMAKMLDPTGLLAKVAAGRTASADWGGQPASSWQTYDERNG